MPDPDFLALISLQAVGGVFRFALIKKQEKGARDGH